MYVVLIGAPGAGKGTQAARVAPQLGLLHLASGDMFRDAIAQGTALGTQAKAHVDRGELVPDEITVGMVVERLRQPDCEGGVLLDGFPRTLGQAEALDRELIHEGQSVGQAVYLAVGQEELVRRLSGRWLCSKCQTPYHEVSHRPRVAGRCDLCAGELYQRSDDTPQTALHRLEVYFEQTTPVIAYYRARGVLEEVDGAGEVASIERDVLAVVRQRIGV